MTDPIADYLTRLRNAIKARHRIVEIPSSKLLLEITKVLFEKGYILNYKMDDTRKPPLIKVALKYHPATQYSAISNIVRISTPGLRRYAGADNLPRVLNGLGIAVLSTSQGIMTDKEAKAKNIGGEVLCSVY